MNLGYFVLLIILKNTHCYGPKRHTQTTSNSKQIKSKSREPVIPARYKISSTTDYDSITADYFPEVEYPSSIIDSSKPFYVSQSPFSDDVKTTFIHLVAAGSSKATPTTDYSWIHNENQKEKSKEKQTITSQNVKEITGTNGNEINSNDTGANEMYHRDQAIINFEGDDTTYYENRLSDNDNQNQFSNRTLADQSTEYREMDYVIDFINDLDTFMENLTRLETQSLSDGYNSTTDILQSECSIELTSVNSHMTLNNNGSITELNENSLFTDRPTDLIQSPLFEEPDTNNVSSIFTSLLNEDITNTFVADMQSEFCNIGKIIHESNNSCSVSCINM